jgi:hypothetical protein
VITDDQPHRRAVIRRTLERAERESKELAYSSIALQQESEANKQKQIAFFLLI